ncbi:MAG: cobalamin biosynthesis protein CbiD, partial [Elusimicrobia bacterium GWA2_38_7]
EATCSVIKDAGDDPDCTNGAELTATVLWINQKGAIVLDRGQGVAVITKKGLGLEVGGPAINPVPRKNITEMVQETAGPFLNEQGLKVLISVPRGEEMAKETQNERLGILGGISILGTTGTVVPFSTAAYKASIAQGIDIVLAAGHDTVVLTTGGRSETYAMKILGFPNECYVQMGDFVGFSTKQAALKGIKKVILCGMPGKMSKIATGKMQTHVAGSQVDMTFLAEMAKEVGASQSVIEEIIKANTARHVHEILTQHGITELWNEVARKVCEVCHKNSEGKIIIECILTDFDGQILGRYEKRTN